MDKLKAYKDVLTQLNVELKENFGFPFTSVNGNMFSFLSKENVLGIRLPKEVRDEFIKAVGSSIYQRPQGQLLKEYVVIPDDLLVREEELQEWFRKSLHYVQSLKPKKK